MLGKLLFNLNALGCGTGIEYTVQEVSSISNPTAFARVLANNCSALEIKLGFIPSCKTDCQQVKGKWELRTKNNRLVGTGVDLAGTVVIEDLCLTDNPVVLTYTVWDSRGSKNSVTLPICLAGGGPVSLPS